MTESALPQGTVKSLLPLVPGSSVDAYLAAISSLPILSAGDEHRLAVQLAEHGDLEAARQLIMSQLKMVAFVAKKYLGYGIPLGDLIQEGNVGLMKAVKRFDSAAGVRLMTFSMYWVKHEIIEFVVRNKRMVNIATTKAQRKLLFNLQKQRRTRSWLTPSELAHIAQTLNVSVRDVREMEYRLAGNDTSFDPAADDDDETAMHSPALVLTDSRYDPARLYEQDDGSDNLVGSISEALSRLDARSRHIVEQRFLSEKKATLQALAELYNVSAERIRQLEKQALALLKESMPAAA